ncbi:hypothetical protein RSOLAG22IIIB_07945 [Rhizoctonia solani]|uniref:Uncharacterized protein n=1 Tax=Rhizoctonia solani TaxID=456999 RepID=A0A0K6FRF6_9AGAM|nr:hypothetical protein RSOLAG22IIIB_07945 [Rhizoctonia solani]
MLKKIQWCFIVTTKTGYRTLPYRVKSFITHNMPSLGLTLYTTDAAIQRAVNKVIEQDAHQCRGSFCKAIFAETIAGRVLEDVANRICSLLSAEVGTPIPGTSRHTLLSCAIRAAEQAVAAQAAGTTVPGNTRVAARNRRPRNDTGFWIAFHAKFNDLVNLHGVTYDDHQGWAQWENEVIGQYQALFTGDVHFAGEVDTFADKD